MACPAGPPASCGPEADMKKLLWIGSPFFASSLDKFGWKTVAHNFEDARAYTWPDIVELNNGTPPDVLVVADKSRPPFVLGMENFPCLTVFYCVDSHIHAWYPKYAQAFDVCLLSLRDDMDRFANLRLPPERILNMPAFAKMDDVPREAEKIHDLMFVGKVDPDTMPGRFAFLYALKERFPDLQVRRGNYRELYPTARLVLNYAEMGDLNFRVFEALGCGACLVTPMVGHGLTDFFTPGEDLFTYPPGDMPALISLLEHLLNVPELCEAVAASGLRKVNAGHRALHRAKAFTERLRALPVRHIIEERLRQAEMIRHNYLRLIYLLWAEECHTPALREAYLKAAKGEV